MLNSDYELILAIPEPVFNYLWAFELIRRSAKKVNMKILVYRIQNPEIAIWIR
jgi:hypothetical protein